jgi:hypothetical protein
MSQSLTCTNGTLNGTYANATCAVTNGPKAVGVTCTAACQCTTGTCAPFYPDADNDGHGALDAGVVQVCASSSSTPPPGFSSLADDCCDSDPLAFPGEGLYYPVADACGDFNYDCSATADPENPSVFAGCTFQTLCAANGEGYTCDESGFSPGWGADGPGAYTSGAAVVPACGVSGALVTGCGSQTADPGTCGGPQSFCIFTAATTVQRCK